MGTQELPNSSGPGIKEMWWRLNEKKRGEEEKEEAGGG